MDKRKENTGIERNGRLTELKDQLQSFFEPLSQLMEASLGHFYIAPCGCVCVCVCVVRV